MSKEARRTSRHADDAKRHEEARREAGQREEPVEATIQDAAEVYWRKLAPELPSNLLTRLAFNFGTVRRITATDTRRKIAADFATRR